MMKSTNSVGRSIAGFLAVSSAAILPCACSITYLDMPYTDAQRHRVVRDAATGEPIPGVMTIFYWDRTDSDIAASRTFCIHVITVESDAAGRYTVPQWRGLWGAIGGHYKRGMAEQWDRESNKAGIDLLRPGSRDAKQRLDELLYYIRFHYRCPDDDMAEMKAFYVAMNDEAQTLTGPGVDDKLKEMFQVAADQASYGPEAAEKRALQRWRARHPPEKAKTVSPPRLPNPYNTWPVSPPEQTR